MIIIKIMFVFYVLLLLCTEVAQNLLEKIMKQMELKPLFIVHIFTQPDGDKQ